MDKVDKDSKEITERQDVSDLVDAQNPEIATESDLLDSVLGSEHMTAAVGSDRANSGVRCGAASRIPEAIRDHITAVIYGHCMGDAIGLLSEFYSKEQAVQV